MSSMHEEYSKWQNYYFFLPTPQSSSPILLSHRPYFSLCFCCPYATCKFLSPVLPLLGYLLSSRLSTCMSHTILYQTICRKLGPRDAGVHHHPQPRPSPFFLTIIMTDITMDRSSSTAIAIAIGIVVGVLLFVFWLLSFRPIIVRSVT